MSKKTNTLLFMLGATVFNILTTIIFFILLLILYGVIIGYMEPEKQAAAAGGSPILFFVAIIISFFFYRFVLKQFMKKFDMEKHFDPLFGKKRPPKKYTD